VCEPPRERSANEDWRLIVLLKYGECERGGWCVWAWKDIEFERSDVGVESSTAEVDVDVLGGWVAVRVEIWAC